MTRQKKKRKMSLATDLELHEALHGLNCPMYAHNNYYIHEMVTLDNFIVKV